MFLNSSCFSTKLKFKPNFKNRLYFLGTLYYLRLRKAERQPGGICLTRGCIPSKLLLYPAELVRDLETAPLFGIKLEIKDIEFRTIMERMRKRIGEDIEMIRQGLTENDYLDYYPETAEFISPYTLKAGDEILHSEMIFLCTGSKPAVPPVRGLEEAGYLTSDTVLGLNECPKSLAILGGSYIGAEYGHFFSAMGAEVTVIGRNQHFLPGRARGLRTCQDKNVRIHAHTYKSRSDRGQKRKEGKKSYCKGQGLGRRNRSYCRRDPRCNRQSPEQ